MTHHTASSCPACGRLQPEDSSGFLCAHCGHKMPSPGGADGEAREAAAAHAAPPQATPGSPSVCPGNDSSPPPPPPPVPAAEKNTLTAGAGADSRPAGREAGGIVLTRGELKAQSLGLWALMLSLLGLVAFLPLASSLAAIYLGTKAKAGGAVPLGRASIILGLLGFIIYASVIIAVIMAAVFIAAQPK